MIVTLSIVIFSPFSEMGVLSMVLVRVDAVKKAFDRVVRGGMSSEVVRIWQPLPSTLLMNERGTEQRGKVQSERLASS